MVLEEECVESMASPGEPEYITRTDKAKNMAQYVERQVEKSSLLVRRLAAVPLLEATLAPLRVDCEAAVLGNSCSA